MRLFVDLATERIVRAAPTPESTNTTTTVNGKWLFEIPEGASVVVHETSTVSQVELDSLAELLIRYPMYDNIIGSWFRDTADMDDIDPTAGTGVLTGSPLRFRMGRNSFGTPPGVAPNCVEVPAMNVSGPTNHPGQLVIGTIDLAVAQPGFPGIPLGTDEVMLWWKVGSFSTSDDVTTPSGGWTAANTNTPAIRTFAETPHTPSGFKAYVSNDDGATWYQAYYLEPLDLVNNGTKFRVCFVNEGDDPVHVLGFCALFPDHWIP